MRYSLDALVDAANISTKELESFQASCAADPSYIPSPNTPHKNLDETLCGKAVEIATSRHSGYLERVFTPFGETYYQLGKDLSQVKYVIGIGGPIIYSDNPKAILQNATQTGESLKPKAPKFLIDKKYIFAAMGLLSHANKELALKILHNELTEV